MEIYTEANEARRWEHTRFVWLAKVIAYDMECALQTLQKLNEIWL